MLPTPDNFVPTSCSHLPHPRCLPKSTAHLLFKGTHGSEEHPPRTCPPSGNREKAVTHAKTAAHLPVEKDSVAETHKDILKTFLKSDTGSPAPSLRRYLASLSARFQEDKRQADLSQKLSKNIPYNSSAQTRPVCLVEDNKL